VTEEWKTLKERIIFQVSIHHSQRPEVSDPNGSSGETRVQGQKTPFPCHRGEKEGSTQSSQADDLGSTGVKNLPQ
jgi:hypothetical protein